MIVGWKIIRIIEEGPCFYIVPIIKKDELSKPIIDPYLDSTELTIDERHILRAYGFFGGDELLKFKIHAMKQVDGLEYHFQNTDLSEVRKLAEKLNLPW
ncbi:MAG: hypothetical protein ACFFDN_44355 [Candidatus Hodarchaeota archaeon]